MVLTEMRWMLGLALGGLAAATAGAPLATETVAAGTTGTAYAVEGVVEAVRQSTIGADLSGRVTALRVQAGDRVKAGEALLRIDERVAAQRATAAKAQLAVARAEFERTRQLHEKNFLSRAAFDRAEAEFKAAQAQAAASGVQTGLHTVIAPYAGIVSEVEVELGDMVMPGRTLVTLYDPGLMRISAHVPQSQTALLVKGPVHIEIPSAPAGLARLSAHGYAVLPAADPGTHTVEVRIPLPAKTGSLAPGIFARVLLPTQVASAGMRATVSASAVVRRSELTAVYIVDGAGRAQLRQVRTGHRIGDRIEILAGLEPGERVALDSLAAARRQ